MGYADVLEVIQGTGAAGAPGITAAARAPLETETWLVASSAGAAITVKDGDILVIDTQSLAGSLRSRCAKLSSAATDIPVGVALLTVGERGAVAGAGGRAEVVIPQTAAAAGNIMQPILVMRRGFHERVSVSTGGAVNNVVGCFAGAAGRGAVPAATTAVTQASGAFANLVGVTLAAAASDVAPMWVCCQFG